MAIQSFLWAHLLYAICFPGSLKEEMEPGFLIVCLCYLVCVCTCKHVYVPVAGVPNESIGSLHLSLHRLYLLGRTVTLSYFSVAMIKYPHKRNSREKLLWPTILGVHRTQNGKVAGA